MDLFELGWDEFHRVNFEAFDGQGLVPARVICEYRHTYAVVGEGGRFAAEVSGRFRHNAPARDGFPTVGDWVAAEPLPGEEKAVIHGLLPRKSAFARKSAGDAVDRQVVAANIDTAFLVSGLDGDFNLRRIERYVTMAWDSGATPVILLNKCDLCADVESHVAEVELVAFGVPVCPVSALAESGLDTIRGYLASGKTVVFLGSSGVGKTTIINRLVGDDSMRTGDVRADDSRGRHTTTRRELVFLPDGGMLIDTPGMRELHMWGDEDRLGQSFRDVEELASGCRFVDCTHENEPGCAVREALDQGRLDRGRYEGYLKLQRELRYVARKSDQRARLDEKLKWKRISQEQKRMYKSSHKYK